MKQNPKMAGSNLIDCVPQHGPCPNNCDQCFYQKWFYAGHEPVIPTLEEAKGKIVRVNSGNDSNHQKERVLDATRYYMRRFFNTSVPDLDFEGSPVVLTINPKQDTCWTAVDDPANLMFVRFRANTWNIDMAQDAIKHYCYERKVPLVMTFMRYYNQGLRNCGIPSSEAQCYEQRNHIDHEYWDITQEAFGEVMNELLPARLLFTCGTPENPYCRDCGVCETLYWRHMILIDRDRMPGRRVLELLEDMGNA